VVSKQTGGVARAIVTNRRSSSPTKPTKGQLDTTSTGEMSACRRRHRLPVATIVIITHEPDVAPRGASGSFGPDGRIVATSAKQEEERSGS